MASSQKYESLKLMTLGDSGVGKTSLVVRYTDSVFDDERLSTIGIDFKKKTIEHNGEKISLQIWDTAGQERFHTITAAYYRGINGVYLVYSVANRQSFNQINKWVKDVESKNSTKVPMVLIANKSDLEEKAVTTEEGMKLASHFQMPFFETSAKTGDCVNECFESLVKIVLEAGFLKPKEEKNVKLEEKGGGGGGGGCCK
mmetsp:Transcript_7352/g.9953  ORF Transcript_7352/g.9953 Transcript_7352/m.9953 type:complete len:200 (+) Transcript_7352:74-673(+)|eukprot:CAMPEP_0201490240 /NCGR_PEP_ID=MMETSP0151_2-20130828/25671_1 /ASSEMBLY_ACC=CAM_ASM_000257 /TAXON_ID=200890 /ORGANISM="Paramoeba atlantica, Strain 621/1 / CCAP 1560/9" /LENGTH=199 /DNA_ID=CAMNT_0047876115 /DNA_START=69 /DNA_END=668 /DNA_ORIENTATION=-